MVKTRVSALMDGELDAYEVEQTMAAFKQDAGSRREWSEFHLIGAAIRLERDLEVDITASVMTALADEPTVLRPAGGPVSSLRHRLRPVLAIAASAAGIAVVGWVALGPAGSAFSEKAQLAALNGTKGASAVIAPVSDQNGKLRDYLVAHHAHAPRATMAEGTRYVRTVSVETERP